MTNNYDDQTWLNSVLLIEDEELEYLSDGIHYFIQCRAYEYLSETNISMDKYQFSLTIL